MLKPCPFCGKEAVIVYDKNLSKWAGVHCRGCHCRTNDFLHNPEGATKAWNSRPGEQVARVKVMKKARKEICQGFGRGINIVLNREFDKLIKAENDSLDA